MKVKLTVMIIHSYPSIGMSLLKAIVQWNNTLRYCSGWSNGTVHFKKCKQLFEYQHLLFR
jgi:hypothetical protein